MNSLPSFFLSSPSETPFTLLFISFMYSYKSHWLSLLLFIHFSWSFLLLLVVCFYNKATWMSVFEVEKTSQVHSTAITMWCVVYHLPLAPGATVNRDGLSRIKRCAQGERSMTVIIRGHESKGEFWQKQYTPSRMQSSPDIRPRVSQEPSFLVRETSWGLTAHQFALGDALLFWG